MDFPNSEITDYPVPPGFEEIPRSARLGVRCTPEALRWVHRLAKHCKLGCSQLIWLLLVEHAQRSGFSVKPPQRYQRQPPNRMF
jgi:hypothetical protein